MSSFRNPDSESLAGASTDADSLVCVPVTWLDSWLMTAGTHDESLVLAACMRLHRTESDTLVVDELDLMTNQVLLAALGTTGVQTATSKLLKALNRSVRRGALVRTWIVDGDDHRTRYLLPKTATADLPQDHTEPENPGAESPTTVKQYSPTGPAVFAAYEDAIGLLTPLIADQIQQSLERYPAEQILDAIRESVRTNRRTWRNIQRILQQWSESGRAPSLDIEVNDEENRRRDQEHLDPDQYRGERHLDRARRLQVRDL